MATTIAIANTAGGSGKTTTVAAMASILSEQQQRVLAIDLDAKGDLTNAFYRQNNATPSTVFDCLVGNTIVNNAIDTRVASDKSTIDLLQGDKRLNDLELNPGNVVVFNGLLERAIEPIKNNYDWILIDCPPSITSLTRMAVKAADYVIAPVKPCKTSIRGLLNLERGILERLREQPDTKARVLGILIVLDHINYSVCKAYSEVISMAANQMGTITFNTHIHEHTEVEKAVAYGISIAEYNLDSPVSQEYNAFVAEMEKSISKERDESTIRKNDVSSHAKETRGTYFKCEKDIYKAVSLASAMRGVPKQKIINDSLRATLLQEIKQVENSNFEQ